MIEKVLENTQNVVKVNGLVVSAVIFADDQAMASNSKAELQRIVNALSKTTNDYGNGMKINIKKVNKS